jgi:hypothetical protein
MGRSLPVRRLSDKLHVVYRARLFISHSTTLSLLCCISAIKRLDPIRSCQWNTLEISVSDHPFHGIAAGRKISQPAAFALFMSGQGLQTPPSVSAPELGFPPLYLGFSDPPSTFSHQRGQVGRGGGKRRGEQKTRFSFALNLSGSGNPEYAIHRVVEPEIDHIES